MDYKAQIQHLKNKNLIIEDDNFATHILSKIGYYGLINGYKEVFKDSTTNRYISDTGAVALRISAQLLFSGKNNCQTSKVSGSWCKINVWTNTLIYRKIIV